MTSTPDRQEAVQLVNEARAVGARDLRSCAGGTELVPRRPAFRIPAVIRQQNRCSTLLGVFHHNLFSAPRWLLRWL
jgi:hypothetical protein